MYKKFFFNLRYKVFYKLELIITNYIISLKNLILHPRSIVGIYDLDNRDLTYDLLEYVIYLNIKTIIKNKNSPVIYFYNTKFKNEKLNFFFIRMLKQINIKYFIINKKIKDKSNNFFLFNTEYFLNRVDDLKFYINLRYKNYKKIYFYLNKILFKDTKINKQINKKIEKYFNKKKINICKLVIISVRNLKGETYKNTKKELIEKLYKYLKKKGLHPLVINEFSRPINFKNIKTYPDASRDVLIRHMLYKSSLLTISTYSGPGTNMIIMSNNCIIFNIKNAKKNKQYFSLRSRFKIYKKIMENKNFVSYMNDNSYSKIKKEIDIFLKKIN